MKDQVFMAVEVWWMKVYSDNVKRYAGLFHAYIIMRRYVIIEVLLFLIL